MLTYDLSKRGKLPLYDFLYRQIKEDILAKRIKADEKLPSKRQLATHHKISVITVENAYNQLLLEGFIYSREKSGYFVSKIDDMLTPLDKNISFKKAEKEDKSYILDISSGNTKPENFPFSIWSRLMRQTLSENYTELLKTVPHKGILELRDAIAEYLYHFKGMKVSSEQIIIGAGTEYLYTLLIQLMGTNAHFSVENPGYKKVSKILSSCGAKWCYTDLDEHGLNLNSLKKSRANIVHTSPTHHYPTGIVMSAQKRRELLNWAYEDSNRYIIEDDYDSEFRFQGRPLPPLFNMDSAGRVIYMNTFSKTIAPSIRISYMVLPYSLLTKYDSTLDFYSSTVPSFDQYTLYKFISEGYYEKHINRTKNSYKTLRDNVIDIISKSKLSEKITITEKDAGLHFLIRINSELPEEEIKKKLALCKIRANFLSDYSYSYDEKFLNTIVFNYSGIDTESLKNALSVLENHISL